MAVQNVSLIKLRVNDDLMHNHDYLDWVSLFQANTNPIIFFHLTRPFCHLYKFDLEYYRVVT